MINMYDNNLVYWIDSEIKDMASVGIDKSKIHDSNRYFAIFEGKYAKVLRDYDFSQITLPQEYLELTETQKESIREYCQVFCSDNSDYERYLSLICHCGFCYEKAGLVESSECKALTANYQFLKELWNQAYPIEYQKFEAEKRGFRETSQPQQPIKPCCIECNSNDTISKGNQWMCKSCGRSWLKNPRKHNRIIPNQIS